MQRLQYANAGKRIAVSFQRNRQTDIAELRAKAKSAFRRRLESRARASESGTGTDQGDGLKTEQCINCRYFARVFGSPAAECRRNPPRIVDAMVAEGLAVRGGSHDTILMTATKFPTILGHEWCGEFRLASE